MRVFRQIGQSLVEFALVLPMLMLLIIGIFDVGRAVFIWATLSNAAREGARYGAIYPSDDLGIYNAMRSKITGVNPWTVSLTKWCDTGDFNSRLGSCGNARAGKDRLVVEANYQFQSIVPGISQLWPSFTVRFTSARTILGSGSGAKYQPPAPTFPPVPTPTPTNTRTPSPTPPATATLPPCPPESPPPTATSGPPPTHSPTPTATPKPCQPVQATPSQPTATATPGQEGAATATPTTAAGQPTATAAGQATPTSTATQAVGASPTSTATGDAPPTATPSGGSPPTSTPSGGTPPTATPTVANSPSPPTDTPVPPTSTPVPPTATNTPTPPNIRIVRIVNGTKNNDKSDEYVEIKNSGGSPGDMNAWALRNDTTGQTFSFSSFTLNAGASVRVWTQNGSNTASDLYWGHSQGVWDNDSDCGSLRNNQGQRVSQYCY